MRYFLPFFSEKHKRLTFKLYKGDLFQVEGEKVEVYVRIVVQRPTKAELLNADLTTVLGRPIAPFLTLQLNEFSEWSKTTRMLWDFERTWTAQVPQGTQGYYFILQAKIGDTLSESVMLDAR